MKLGQKLATEEAAERQEALAPPRALKAIFANGSARLAVLAMAIGQLIMTILMVITPVHMSFLNHDTGAISWVIMAHTLGMFGLSGVSGRLTTRFGRRAIIGSGALVLVAACLLTPLATTVPMLALALFLLGLGWNFCYVAGSALLTDSLQANERGRAQGANEVVVALASGAGSLSTGALYAFGSIVTISALGLALTLFLAVALAASSIRGRETIPSQSP